jgi:hypothetical protein
MTVGCRREAGATRISLSGEALGAVVMGPSSGRQRVRARVKGKYLRASRGSCFLRSDVNRDFPTGGTLHGQRRHGARRGRQQAGWRLSATGEVMSPSTAPAALARVLPQLVVAKSASLGDEHRRTGAQSIARPPRPRPPPKFPCLDFSPRRRLHPAAPAVPPNPAPTTHTITNTSTATHPTSQWPKAHAQAARR